jgi:hypothetical protein
MSRRESRCRDADENVEIRLATEENLALRGCLWLGEQARQGRRER